MTQTDDEPIDILEDDAPPPPAPAHGFLPIETNWFDRLFISLVIWVAICLVWLRFIEPLGADLYIAHGVSVALGLYIIWKG
ncbi:DUF2160 family membrane protein [Allosediminivita pacifica]|uniref:Putative small integral membrane protein DUF2160 n=1 Tax=Allosediminivita pacifica TaxID=1267769 RepID=A0A2T6AD79_9RHOB|nr:DUF2160 family membrane protein [Allosediminivita pacifica]PTX41773.1 putative small integral membrane protein DUF2160 [Allosediminivita pacifica]GGB22654.1 hypothetical protein GCM10011324_35820 [Allosediminivita pacifica]